MSHNVGYCCINLTLQKSRNLTTNRGMILRTFEQRGIHYASELALQNARDLVEIIKWNSLQNIRVFRISSDIFPWNSKYKLTDLPDFDKICTTLRTAGDIAKLTKQRITAHPDHFVKLGSTKEEVVNNAIHDLEHHSEVFDLMGLEVSHYNCLNIHVGMNFSQEVAYRWITNYHKLSKNCQSRLVVENDDKENAFSVRQLYYYLHNVINIPITFDYFHHQFHPDGWDSKDAAKVAAGTWPQGIRPLFHYSESKNINENVSGNPRAHADYVFNVLDDYGLDIDVDIEAKAKELALFKYWSLL